MENKLLKQYKTMRTGEVLSIMMIGLAVLLFQLITSTISWEAPTIIILSIPLLMLAKYKTTVSASKIKLSFTMQGLMLIAMFLVIAIKASPIYYINTVMIIVLYIMINKAMNKVKSKSDVVRAYTLKLCSIVFPSGMIVVSSMILAYSSNIYLSLLAILIRFFLGIFLIGASISISKTKKRVKLGENKEKVFGEFL